MQHEGFMELQEVSPPVRGSALIILRAHSRSPRPRLLPPLAPQKKQAHTWRQKPRGRCRAPMSNLKVRHNTSKPPQLTTNCPCIAVSRMDAESPPLGAQQGCFPTRARGVLSPPRPSTLLQLPSLALSLAVFSPLPRPYPALAADVQGVPALTTEFQVHTPTSLLWHIHRLSPMLHFGRDSKDSKGDAVVEASLGDEVGLSTSPLVVAFSLYPSLSHAPHAADLQPT